MNKPSQRDISFSSAETRSSRQINGGPIIQVEAVSKIFHTPAGNFTALENVSIDIYAGEFVSVVGKSGSGKSTLVNMLTGIDHPNQGTVRILGQNIHEVNESEISIWRGKNLGIVFQFFQLLPMLTVIENVMLPMDLAKRYPANERADRAHHLLKMVDLVDVADKLPGAISGGQQQSAAIARALANDPPILIADEPTGNLDSKTAGEVFSIFHQLSDEGKTILMVTHDPNLARLCKRTLLLLDGKLIPPGSPLFAQIISAATGQDNKRNEAYSI